MKVRLKVSRAGTGFAQSVGDEIEVGEAEGRRMIQRDQAEMIPNAFVPKPTVDEPEGNPVPSKRKSSKPKPDDSE